MVDRAASGPVNFMVAAQVASYWHGIMQMRKAMSLGVKLLDWRELPEVV